MSQLLEKISNLAEEPLNPDTSRELAIDINKWLYSAGGLYAGRTTRRVLLVLRDSCHEWKEGPIPETIHHYMEWSILRLRNDLDLQGLDDWTEEDTTFSESLSGEDKRLKKK